MSTTTTEALTIDHDADLDAILEALQEAHDLEGWHHADALATTVAARYALRRAEQWPQIVRTVLTSAFGSTTVSPDFASDFLIIEKGSALFCSCGISEIFVRSSR